MSTDRPPSAASPGTGDGGTPEPQAVEGGPLVELTAGHLAWLEARVDVSQSLLDLNRGVGPVAQDVIEHIRRLSQARTVTFVGPSRTEETQFHVRLATGVGARNLLGRSYAKAGTLEGRAMQENRAFLSTSEDSYSHHLEADAEKPSGPLFAVPFDCPGENERGAIIASRGRGEPPFSEAELAMAGDFARQCSIALQLVEAQADREQLRFREQRDAETKRLHDDLIQQLFGLGITLESLRADQRATPETAPQQQAEDLWQQASGQIDAMINQLRTTLTAAPAPDH